MHMDNTDRKLLAALQDNAQLTNGELASIVGLSASQCSRRRTQLESEGLISGYHAKLDREKVGIGLTSFVSVTLSKHNANNAQLILELFQSLPEVLEAHAMTGEMDYHVKVVTKDLKSLSTFINNALLTHEAVQNVKTAISLQTLKETQNVPL